MLRARLNIDLRLIFYQIFCQMNDLQMCGLWIFKNFEDISSKIPFSGQYQIKAFQSILDAIRTLEIGQK